MIAAISRTVMNYSIRSTGLLNSDFCSNRLVMRFIFTIALLLVLHTGWCQDNPEAIEFFSNMGDCAGSLGGWKCLELDLSSETVVENDSSKKYNYSWNFGDGTRKEGNKTEHCYADFGSYQVSMDLIDL